VTSDFLHVPLRVLPPDSGCVIDCDTCTVRGDACDDCVVSVMLGGPPDTPIAADEHRALAVLAQAGLVPPLQMTPPAPPDGGAPPGAGPEGAVPNGAVPDGAAPPAPPTPPVRPARAAAPNATTPGRPAPSPGGPAPGGPGPGASGPRS
jgi:hypothetical protein